MTKVTKKQKSLDGKVEPMKLYKVDAAIDLLKSLASTKFDETLEVAINLGVDPRHADQMVRGVVNLPKGTGKDVRVAVFARGAKAEEATAAGAEVVGAEDLMEAIQGGKTDFDRVIATPDMMGIVGRLGKVLGPKGLAEPQAGHGHDGRHQGGYRRQVGPGRIPRRESRDHPCRHRQGERPGG